MWVTKNFPQKIWDVVLKRLRSTYYYLPGITKINNDGVARLSITHTPKLFSRYFSEILTSAVSQLLQRINNKDNSAKKSLFIKKLTKFSI